MRKCRFFLGSRSRILFSSNWVHDTKYEVNVFVNLFLSVFLLLIIIIYYWNWYLLLEINFVNFYLPLAYFFKIESKYPFSSVIFQTIQKFLIAKNHTKISITQSLILIKSRIKESKKYLLKLILFNKIIKKIEYNHLDLNLFKIIIIIKYKCGLIDFIICFIKILSTQIKSAKSVFSICHIYSYYFFTRI